MAVTAGDSVTTASLDYVQRSGSAPADLADAPSRTAAGPDRRRLLAVRGIGRAEKTPAAPERETRGLPTEDLLNGLYGYRIPLAFTISGGAETTFQIGVWSSRDGPGEVLDRRRDVLATLLHGLYPIVRLGPGDAERTPLPLSGIALGTPTAKRPEPGDPTAPLDRVVRALLGTAWSVTVLAYPVAESAVEALRHGLINEMRAAEAAAKREAAPSPLVEHYGELLTKALESLRRAAALGAWRVAAYLEGDADSYPRLAAVWRSAFSGEHSLPEPVRVFDAPVAGALAAAWALPDREGAPGPGYYRRPFEHQTLLTSAQLSAYVHFPEVETPGFAVDLAPQFDTVAAERPSADRTIELGTILQGDRDAAATRRIARDSLTKHTLVAGVTGSGKTTTVMSLLLEAGEAGIPFLVIEPTKTEYRSLIAHPGLGDRVRVLTAGEETVSPFRLNPFEVPPGATVAQHLDLLRAVFGASFGMWTPLPQVLERCLHEVYGDRGWELRANGNPRLGEGPVPAAAFPTLTDLVAKVDEVAPALGYEQRVTDDIRAALTTRLESLRIGGKGAMLDVSRSLPFEELLSSPAVLELDAMGDEADKAFLMGLLLVRLVEHRRASGPAAGLVHLLVVEEAHRLLANVPQTGSDEVANPRGQAVETFANLLSEIRAYGQGVVVADQIPVRLAPDAVKNTSLKVAHRIVAQDDREALAGSMGMDEAQARALMTLRPGQAAVFGEADDAPMLVRVRPAQQLVGRHPPSNAEVAEHAARWHASTGYDRLLRPEPFCAETCRSPAACETARRLLDDGVVRRALGRVVLSAIEDAGALDRMWPDVVGVVRARRPTSADEEDVLLALAGHGAAWFAGRRGSQGLWPYGATEELAQLLRRALIDRVHGRADDDARLRFRTRFRELSRRPRDPYPYCGVVCGKDPPVCLYRSAVADVVASRRFHESWREADAGDARATEPSQKQTWEVCQDAGYELIEFPESDWPDDLRERVTGAARRACLCFEQQMLAGDERKVPRTVRVVTRQVLREAGLG